jgi:hypothetical protein
MSQADLLALISRVETEIDAYDDLPGEAVENVQGLLGEIAQRLEHPREDNQGQDLIDGLKGAIEQYEATHPKVTVLLSNLMNTLASMGI